MSTALVVRASHRSLQHHARTFSLASLLLPASVRDDLAVTYAVCRLMDDIADRRGSVRQAAARLDGLESELRGLSRPRPLIHAFRDVCGRRRFPMQAPRQLLNGIRSDLGTVRIADDRALLRYAYRVAGTVGVMMHRLLGVPAAGLGAAVDLGIGMQITNICRDVREDLGIGRVYLPETRLRAAGTSQEALLEAPTAPHVRSAVSGVVRDLLGDAERYYRSAQQGMRWVPARTRGAILGAAWMYREIGRQLLRRPEAALDERTTISPLRKAILLAAAIPRAATLGLGRHRPHDPLLHDAFHDLVPDVA